MRCHFRYSGPAPWPSTTPSGRRCGRPVAVPRRGELLRRPARRAEGYHRFTVVYAAGNLGPAQQVVSNSAPWVITVAASKIDRSFPTVITLGNKQQIVVPYGTQVWSLDKNPTRP